MDPGSKRFENYCSRLCQFGEEPFKKHGVLYSYNKSKNNIQNVQQIKQNTKMQNISILDKNCVNKLLL